MAQMKLVIRYNAERGYEEPALQFARRLFAEFDEAIDELTLVPDPDEEFAVYLNGRLVRSRSQSGSSPRIADVRSARDQS